MPFKSDSQRRYFHWKAKSDPTWARRAKKWEGHTPKGDLPEKVGGVMFDQQMMDSFLNEHEKIAEAIRLRAAKGVQRLTAYLSRGKELTQRAEITANAPTRLRPAARKAYFNAPHGKSGLTRNQEVKRLDVRDARVNKLRSQTIRGEHELKIQHAKAKKQPVRAALYRLNSLLDK